MSVNIYKIKKWAAMLSGKSLLYVNQGPGKSFVPGEIKGYFNDLTEKVTNDPETLSKRALPKMKNESGEDIVFATTIFQYGLGCYDLLLQTGKQEYIEQFQNCVNWSVDNQDEYGGWDISAYAGKNSKYGSMAQGEGISLLARAYVYSGDNKYKDAAVRAGNLLISDVKKGGTCLKESNRCVFLEFTDKPAVLNGWIFSIFGLYDLTLIENSDSFKNVLKLSLDSLKEELPRYDNGYWSLYDMGGAIASPFYHKLHIAQLQALYRSTGEDIFNLYRTKFETYGANKINKSRAFVVKSIQKITER